MSFQYDVESPDGAALSGTIQAADEAEAAQRLGGLGLAIRRLTPTLPARPLSLDHLRAFNLQLAHLVEAGLPLERGLRLIAEDVRRGRLAGAVEAVADELERGASLDEAFAMHRGRFPSLYGRLVAAGVRAANLPRMLLEMGRHLALVAKLRSMLWQASAYPAFVVGVLTVLATVLWLLLVGGFEQVFRDFDATMPALTRWLLITAPVLPLILAGVLLVLLLLPLAAGVVSLTGGRRLEAALRRVPLIGRVVERNLVARWCHAVRLGVIGGMDLPSAIDLAGDAIASATLRRDGAEMRRRLEAGENLAGGAGYRLVPPAAVIAMDRGARGGDLETVLESLAELHEHRAELALGRVRDLSGPLLVLVAGGMIAFTVIVLFLPLVKLVSSLT